MDIRTNDGRFTLPFGWLAYLGAGLSLLMCYTNVLLRIGAGQTFGSIGLNPHVQAVLMWTFGLVAVIGLVRDRKHHERSSPLVTGIFALIVIVGTLYTFYDRSILIFGYILLVVAAFLNQNMMLLHLNRKVQAQAHELDTLNSTLERRVEAQVGEIERLARLKRFLAPEVAELVTAQDKGSLLDSHRRYIATLFCDIRGFTSFSEGSEPEEVIGVLQTYHERLGRLVAEHGGTLAHRAGDGLMVFFNDPIPSDEPVLKAIKLALEMRHTFDGLREEWKRRSYQLGFGVGIAGGYATMGVIGFEGRYDYTANGNVVNLASRLCDEAADGEILISHKAFVEVENAVEVEGTRQLDLKGFGEAIPAHNVIGLAEDVQARVSG